MSKCLVITVAWEKSISQMCVECAGLYSVMYWFTSSLLRTFIVPVAFVILQEDLYTVFSKLIWTQMILPDWCFILQSLQHFLNLFEYRPCFRIGVSWNILLGTTAVDNRESINSFKYKNIAYSNSKVEEECERRKVRWKQIIIFL